MFKTLSTVLLCFFLSAAFAQKNDTTVYYVAKPSQKVSTKDSADIVVVILPQDTNVNRNLFPVRQFYKNGKKRLVGYSLTNNFRPKYQGVVVLFDTNGRKIRVSNYDNGSLLGNVTTYYPNGNLYYVKSYTKDQPVSFKECRDSTGKILVKNGNGIWKEYLDQKFDENYIEGEVTSGLQQGQWQAKLTDGSKLVLMYKDGYYANLIDKIVPILQRLPHFPGEKVDFDQFISRNLHFPEEARRLGIRGEVRVSFLVDIDGIISNIKVDKGIGGGCDEEAVRLIKLFPPWRPSIQNNEFVPMTYGFPIAFF